VSECFINKYERSVTNDAVFTLQTANWVKLGSILLLADAGILFSGKLWIVSPEIFWRVPNKFLEKH